MSKKLLIGLIVVVVLVAGFFFLGSPEKEAPKVIAADPATERMINAGKIIGFIDRNNSHAWLGIPFAKPPVGDLRWKAPRLPESWTDTRETLYFGSMCTQPAGRLNGHPDAGPDDIAGEEDCLYLNVWAPPYTEEAVPTGDNLLPVMFWIHGGGNTIGHAGQEMYNGSRLATLQDVIVVSINYRLGPFGWFTHPALQEPGGSMEDNSGNFGTLDIVRGLEWVQENIAAFGGDPNNVTIFGESAGGVNVLSMMASPRANGLFHKAICQSGGLWVNPVFMGQNYEDEIPAGNKCSSKEIVNLALIKDGVAADRAAAKTHQDGMPPDEIAQYLRGKSNEEIIRLYPERNAGMIRMPLLFADGVVLSKKPLQVLFKDTGIYNDVPLMIGTNRDESKLFMSMDPKNVKRILGIFPRLKDPEAYDRDARYGTDSWRIHGVDTPARLLRDTQGPTVFAYRFDWDEERSILGYDLSKALGAAHGLEIPFVFNNLDADLTGRSIYRKDKTAGRDALSKSMMSYWAQFAYTGNPGKGRDGTEVEWKPWDNTSDDSDKFIVFDTQEDGGIRMVSDELTLQDLKDRLLADKSFDNQEDYCRTYVQLFGLSPLWNQEEYENLGEQGCKEFDPKKFPRR